MENENHILRQKAFSINSLSVAPKTLSEVVFFLTLYLFRVFVCDATMIRSNMLDSRSYHCSSNWYDF